MEYIVKTGEIVDVEISGRLDTLNAPKLMEELKTLIGTEVKTIVFKFANLDYISSAGIRSIVFAKQKLGTDVNVVLDSANDTVRNVFKMSGLESYVEFVNS